MVKKSKVKRVRKWRGWAGIVGSTIHTTVEKDSNYPIRAIYRSKRVAKLAYESVVPVEIREVRR